MYILQNKIFWFSAILVINSINCIKEYNPYKDYSNVEVVIKNQSVAFGEDINIFSTQSLTLIAGFAELIDSITISIDSNRLWKDTTFIPKPSTEYTIPFSFFTTGNMYVTIKTLLGNGTIDSIYNKYTVVSPLRPESVTGYLGSETIISTKGVKDNDILYVWDFGEKNIVKTQKTQDVTIFNRPIHNHYGTLCVKEFNSTLQSPAVTFYFTLQDTIFPTIVSENSNLKDSMIATGNESFTFIANIYDQAKRLVDSASIQGISFAYFDRERELYASRFFNIPSYTKSNPLKIIVNAFDNIGTEYNTNITRKNYYVYYDSTLTPENIVLIKISGIDEHITTAKTDYYLYGDIWNNTRDTLIMQITLNDSVISSNDTINPDLLQNWNEILSLSQKGENLVTVSAKNKGSNNITASEKRIIYYVPDFSDSSGPIIIELIVNDTIFIKNKNLTIIHDSLVSISVRASDQVSDIKNLSVNNISASPDAEKLLWKCKDIIVTHNPLDSITVHAVDDSGHETTISYAILFNSTPSLDIMKDSLRVSNLIAGTTYLDTIYYFDPDKEDAVSVQMLYNNKWILDQQSAMETH